MAAVRKYRHYPDSIKLEVARTKDPYRFPELQIPRTTALYWIRKSKDLKSLAPDLVESERVQKLQSELEMQKELLRLVQKVRLIFSHPFRSRNVISKAKRKQVIQAVLLAAKSNRISDCLQIIGLPKKLYSQWLSEFFLCESQQGSCDQRRPNQLTNIEINRMKSFVTSKKYSHIPISSLYLLAQRLGVLFCSIDSWYKYTKIFGWIRPRMKTEEGTSKLVGIRAQAPNEIWHVDVTQVKTTIRDTIYIQVVYDNFSRFVIAWSISSQVNANTTVALLEKAKSKVLEMGQSKSSKVVMDGGPENDNGKVLQFVSSKNLMRLIAGVDIHFSNSMVESLFRGLKSNFLRTEKLGSLKDVQDKVDFYFQEHNAKIPKSIFKGATPNEIFMDLWGLGKEMELKDGMQKAMQERRRTYLEKSCRLCSQ